MSHKTLIIVDNSSELTTYNQEVIKETVKYLIKNAPEETSIALAVTGENAEYLCEYDDSFATKLKTAEELKFVDVNASALDAVTDVILGWKNDDLAMRDIILISGSDITCNADYTLEELFYEIGSREYPVYTITCPQDGNESYIKTISSVSRISGGTSVDITNDAEEDANVEKQLGDKLLAAMSENRSMYENMENGGYNDNDERDEYPDENYEDDDYDENGEETEAVDVENRMAGNDVYTQKSSNMIYQLPDNDIKYSKFIVPVALVIAASVAFYLVMRHKGKKDKDEEEKYYRRVIPKDQGHVDMNERLPFEGIESMENVTMNLSSYEDDDEDSGTRLLYQSREGVELTLEDRANPTKYFKFCVSDSIVIGRNTKMADIVIDYDDSVSSKHCEFYLRGGSVYLRDLNSSNGTMINQQKIYQEVKLESGDVLRIGRLSFFVQIVGGVNG